MSLKLPTFEDVIAARDRIIPHVYRTPVLTSSYFDGLVGARLFFKCENFQKTGSFKARGACNAVFVLDDETAAKGVATHSSGNHGQAISYAAGKRGVGAQVVMPSGVLDAKKAAVKAYGGEAIECAPTLAARETTLSEVIERSGAESIHPYNDARVIAGQATCALELFEDNGPFDAMVAPIGGGGLISGTCLAMAALSSDTKVYAAEPAGADDAFRSFKAGELTKIDHPDTIADGLRASLGPLTWRFVSTGLADVLVVEEHEIIDAMRLLWERMKLVVEPSSAVALAAVLKNRDVFAGQRVGIILTGGNADLENLPWLREQGVGGVERE